MAEDADTPYRVAMFDDLRALKQRLISHPCVRISDCEAACAGSLQAVQSKPFAEFRSDCGGFRVEDKKKQDRILSSLFGAREARNWNEHHQHKSVRVAFATAHASKGETHDAVLLVAKKTAGLCGCPQSATGWKKIFQHPMAECEAKRIVYVAMSRAAQHLMVLTPAGADGPWRDLTPEADIL